MPADDRDPSPEFGPGGYLPERAAKRARKIVLREQMGMQWPIAAVAAAVLVLIAGGIFLATGTGPPDAPFQPAADIAEVDPRGAAVLSAGGADVLVVRAGGGVRVFRAPDDVIAWCAESGRIESPEGSVWNANGRLVGGPGRSLAPVPSQVHRGVLYVDATSPAPPIPPEDGGERPICAD